MARTEMLDGWDVHVQHRNTVDDEGTVVRVWVLIFVERDTGNTIRYEHGDRVRDHILQGYNPGVILPDTPLG